MSGKRRHLFPILLCLGSPSVIEIAAFSIFLEMASVPTSWQAHFWFFLMAYRVGAWKVEEGNGYGKRMEKGQLLYLARQEAADTRQRQQHTPKWLALSEAVKGERGLARSSSEKHTNRVCPWAWARGPLPSCFSETTREGAETA